MLNPLFQLASDDWVEKKQSQTQSLQNSLHIDTSSFLCSISPHKPIGLDPELVSPTQYLPKTKNSCSNSIKIIQTNHSIKIKHQTHAANSVI